jgi:hypothetical protein
MSRTLNIASSFLASLAALMLVVGGLMSTSIADEVVDGEGSEGCISFECGNVTVCFENPLPNCLASDEYQCGFYCQSQILNGNEDVCACYYDGDD